MLSLHLRYLKLHRDVKVRIRLRLDAGCNCYDHDVCSTNVSSSCLKKSSFGFLHAAHAYFTNEYIIGVQVICNLGPQKEPKISVAKRDGCFFAFLSEYYITMASQERIRPVIKGSGFWHVPTVKEYSQETQELLKVMMQESKLTCFQQRHLVNCMKRGDAFPVHCYPTSSREPEFPKPVLPKIILTTSLCGRPHLRPAEICRAGDAYIREKFKPQATRDIEKEKERLQNILATGKDKVEKKTQKKPVKVEETVPEVDRFDELVNEIQDRQNFLSEMKALGQSKVYQGIIQTEISQKLREMEMIDKQRTAELKGAIAKSFNISIKHDNQSTGHVDQ